MIGRRKPIAKVGKRGKRLEPLLNSQRRAVRKRSHGWCEVAGCGKPASGGCHHAFGRGGTGARLGDRWANHPALGTDVCQSHHDRLTGQIGGLDQALVHQVRCAAVARLAATRGWVKSLSAGEDPVVLVRQLISAIEAIEGLEVESGR